VLSYVLDEFTLALFLVGSSFPTLPLYIQQLFNNYPQYAMVLSQLSFLIALGVAGILIPLSRRHLTPAINT
jgi:ABC-type spermidine/putrescine transport system permease subunit II